jgi:hypothetical protein
VARLPMTSVLRARTTGETRGFMKTLIDAHSDAILGFTMLGADGALPGPAIFPVPGDHANRLGRGVTVPGRPKDT